MVILECCLAERNQGSCRRVAYVAEVLCKLEKNVWGEGAKRGGIKGVKGRERMQERDIQEERTQEQETQEGKWERGNLGIRQERQIEKWQSNNFSDKQGQTLFDFPKQIVISQQNHQVQLNSGKQSD